MSSPRRGGLGDSDPLAARPRRVPPIIPNRIVVEDPADAVPAVVTPGPGPKPPGKPTSTKVVPKTKTQIGVYVDSEVLSAAKDAVIALTAEPGGPRSLSQLVEQALRNETTRLAQKYNGGHPFRPRRVELQPGRPTN